MQNMVGVLGAFKEKYLAWMNLPSITKTDIIEIIIIAFLIYHVMLWFKNTRAWTLFKGLIVILVFVFVAALFQMNTILWIAGKAFNVGIVALVVVFQPELRKALEDLGRKNFVPSCSVSSILIFHVSARKSSVSVRSMNWSRRAMRWER